MRWHTLLIAVALLAASMGAQAETQSIDDLLGYLSIPEAECNFGWFYESEFFDPLLANPVVSYEALRLQHREAYRLDELSRAKLKLDLSRVSSKLDSVDAAHRYANEARDILERSDVGQGVAARYLLLGRTYEELGEEKTARRWYEKVYELDRNQYIACFRLAKKTGKAPDLELKLWRKRTRETFDRLRGSNDVQIRANLFYEYAGVLSDVSQDNEAGELFTQMADVVKSSMESEDADEAAAFRMFMESALFPRQEIVDLLKAAADLEPTNAQYQGTYASAAIGRAFVSRVEQLIDEGRDSAEKNPPDAEAMLRLFERCRPVAFDVRQRLTMLPMADRVRYPAINLYLANANFLLGDYRIAYDQALSFLRAQSESEQGYAFLCGIALMKMRENEQSRSEVLRQLVDLTERKCLDRPTCGDCYRLGSLLWNIGNLQESVAVFQRAALFCENIRPRLALAVVSLQLGDIANARTLAHSLKRNQACDDVGPHRVCYQTILSVLAAAQNDHATALHWAKLAAEANEDDKDVQGLLSALKSR